jgi:hypothetical protein
MIFRLGTAKSPIETNVFIFKQTHRDRFGPQDRPGDGGIREGGIRGVGERGLRGLLDRLGQHARHEPNRQ